MGRALAVLGLVLALQPFGAAPAQAQDTGLDMAGKTTYRLEPSSEIVHVTVQTHLVNTLPSRTYGSYIETPYFDSFGFPVLGPVANVEANSSLGGGLSVDVQGRPNRMQVIV